jgi:hypothetical protein
MLQRIIEGIKERTPPPRRVQRQPVYMRDAYVCLLRRHYHECGLPEPDWIDEIPESTEELQRTLVDLEPKIEFSDSVVVTLTPDEDSEEVHVHASGAMADMYAATYARGEAPPIESLVRVYKHLGYSEKYLMEMLKKHDRHLERIKKVNLDKIFKADSGSKTKRVKKKDEVIVEELDNELEEDLDDDEDDEDAPPPDDAFDMEIDEDEDAEVQDDEEEYISE